MNIVVAENHVPAMRDEDIAKVRELEARLLAMPQVPIGTEHVLHGGLYARTIRIPEGVVLTGVLVRVPTLLIFDGHATVNLGGEAVALTGHHVLAASAHRRQAFLAHADTQLTMVFATQAKTVAEAEDEFTAEADLLLSRHPGALNRITITGE